MTAKLDIRMDPAQVDAALKGTKTNVEQLAGEFAKLGPEAAKFAKQVATSYSQLQRDNSRLRGEIQRLTPSLEQADRGFRDLVRDAEALGEKGAAAVKAYQEQLRGLQTERGRSQGNGAAAELVATERYERGIRSAREALQSQTTAIREQQAEHKRLESVAKSAIQAQLTPQEQLRAKLLDLKRAWEQGSLSVNQYKQSVRDAYSQTTIHGGAVKKTAGEFQTLGQTAGSFFSQHATNIASAIGSYASLQGAIRLTTGIIGEMRREQEKAKAATDASRTEMSELAQLAESPEEFVQLSDMARRIYKAGGARDMSQAAKLTFSLASVGAQKDEPLFVSMARSGMVRDAAGVAESAMMLKSAMGEKETGSNAEMISKALGAAKYAPGKAEDIFAATANAGASAAALKLKDEETMAATAVVSLAVGTDEAGTAMDSLLRGLGQAQAERITMARREKELQDKANALYAEMLKANEDAQAVKVELTDKQRAELAAAKVALDGIDKDIAETSNLVPNRRMSQADKDQRLAELNSRRDVQVARIAEMEGLQEQATEDKRRPLLQRSADLERQLAETRVEMADVKRKRERETVGDIAGKPLMDTVHEIESRNLNQAELMGLLGRSEAIRAFRLLSTNQDRFKDIEGEIQTAGKERRVEQKVRYFESDPTLAAADLASRSKANREDSARIQGMFTNIRWAVEDQIVTRLRKEKGEGAVAFREMGRKITDNVMTDEMYVRMMYNQARDAGGLDKLDQSELGRQIRQVVELADGVRQMVELQKESNELAKQRTSATARTADALTIAPGAGSTAAAAQPPVQRLGR